MRHLIFLGLMIVGTANQASAETHYSEMIDRIGLGPAREEIAALPDPTASDRFALGGLAFLGAVEGALQTRYKHDLNSESMAMLADLPFLRLPVEPNPTPSPFTPDVATLLFTDILADLEESRLALDAILDDDTVTVPIRPADIWFDINANGRRDVGEGMSDVVSNVFGASDGPIDPNLLVQFDTADAAWLSAYAHMLSGMSELILSTDPEEAIAAVLSGAQKLDQVRGATPLQLGFFSEGELGELDALAILIVALEGPLDPTRTRAAHAHFQGALDDNRQFWTRLNAENDNMAEWIPNERQNSALPLTFPQGIGASWQEVLADAEAILDGRLLLPHWRLADSGGINMSKLMQDPPVIDVIGLIHGYSLAPYAEPGPLVTTESLSRFDEITGGNSPFFAILLN